MRLRKTTNSNVDQLGSPLVHSIITQPQSSDSLASRSKLPFEEERRRIFMYNRNTFNWIFSTGIVDNKIKKKI